MASIKCFNFLVLFDVFRRFIRILFWIIFYCRVSVIAAVLGRFRQSLHWGELSLIKSIFGVLVRSHLCWVPIQCLFILFILRDIPAVLIICLPVLKISVVDLSIFVLRDASNLPFVGHQVLIVAVWRSLVVALLIKSLLTVLRGKVIKAPGSVEILIVVEARFNQSLPWRSCRVIVGGLDDWGNDIFISILFWSYHVLQSFNEEVIFTWL